MSHSAVPGRKRPQPGNEEAKADERMALRTAQELWSPQGEEKSNSLRAPRAFPR